MMPMLVRIVVLFLTLAVAASGRAAELMSTEDLVKSREKWPLLIGTDFRVEIRVKIFGPHFLTVLGTELAFRSEGVMTRDPRGNRYEAIGTIMKEAMGDRYFYLVRELKPLPSDQELLKEKRGKIVTNRSEQWYEVAAWAEDRGKKFDDLELLRESKDLYQNGLETEYSQLAPRDPKGIRDLVAKLDRWKLDPDLRARMVFEAFQVEYDQGLKNPKANFSDLLSRIGRDLEGAASTPLADDDAPLREKFAASPLEAYRIAKPALRPKFHRMLYVDTFRSRILRDAESEGRSGREIADRLAQIPELAALGKDYREKDVVNRFARVATMTRQEMLDFAKLLDEEKDNRGAELRRKWLAAREPGRRKQGVNGLVELGDDAIALLGDKGTALRFYLDAEQLSPNLGIVTDRLKKLDYVLYEGRWIPKELVPPATADPFYEAVQNGQVKIGMSPKHVRAALGSAPDEVIRTVSGAGVKEWWTYRADSISVELASARGDRSPPKVTRVFRTGGAAKDPAADKAAPPPAQVAPGQ